MPEYCYVAEDGERAAVVRSKPPKYLKRKGKVFRRDHRLEWSGTVSGVRVLVHGATTRKMQDRVFESHQLPRWDPDAPRHGPSGKPRFANQREIDEYCAKKRHKEGLDLRYGEL